MNMEMIYQDLGISAEVLQAGEKLEQELKDRFDTFDKTAEYNQLKVIHAMQKNKVSEDAFNTQADMDTMIWDEIHWNRYTRIPSYGSRIGPSTDHLRNSRAGACAFRKFTSGG